MSNAIDFKEKWNDFCRKIGPALDTTGEVLARIGHVLKIIGGYIYKLRKVFYAIPVVVAAIKLAMMNMEKLPEIVGISIQADGTYAAMVSQNVAVFGPVLVTGICLVLMFCSRKTLYPWLISVFSLLLPLLIYATNVFPA